MTSLAADATSTGARRALDGPTLDQVREWPATVDIGRAGKALGLSRSWCYQLVSQGEFPCKVLTIGCRSRVLTSSLLSLLETGEA